MQTRFAPSLTGYLHLGHVLHMIYVWGVARAKGASILTRIEDHDRGRARPEFESSILETTEWLGFVSDDGLQRSTADGPCDFRQSDCGAVYTQMLEQLTQQGLVYGCSCTRKEIQAQQPAEQDELCYSGTCADKHLPLEGHTVRFRVPAGEVTFDDLRLGRSTQQPALQCGDFSLRDRDGQWSYQFCCVCDDIRHGVDLVIRGEDILSSTARQIRLFEAFNAPIPDFFHHPLLCDAEGHKLSKRQHAESITAMRDAGQCSSEIIGRAALAGNLISEYHPMTVKEATTLLMDSIGR